MGSAAAPGNLRHDHIMACATQRRNLLADALLQGKVVLRQH
jgi:hypothetical protein